MNSFTLPKKIYFEKNSLQYLIKMENVNRVLLITCDKAINNGFVDIVRQELAKRKNDVKVEVVSVLKGEEEAAIAQATETASNFQSDTIIALGCGRVMRVAKEVASASAGQLAAIPITSAAGGEMSFAQDGKTMADVTIIDGQFVIANSELKTAKTGLVVLKNAIGSYLSDKANDYSKGFSLQAAKITFASLEKSVQGVDYESREHMHNAAAIAGIAVNNTGFKGTLDEVLKDLAKATNKEKVAEIANYVGFSDTKAADLLKQIEELKSCILK